MSALGVPDIDINHRESDEVAPSLSESAGGRRLAGEYYTAWRKTQRGRGELG